MADSAIHARVTVMPSLITNVGVYRAIAEQAAAESKRLAEAGRRPKPDGRPGYVVTLDPEKRSFKQAMIAIAFAGMYLEALLRLAGRKSLPKGDLRKFNKSTWEQQATRLGVQDPGILAGCLRLRKVRNDLVHETVVDLDETAEAGEWWTAQEEVTLAIDLIRRISGMLSRS